MPREDRVHPVLSLLLPTLGILLARPAAGQDYDAMAKWTAAKVVHYKIAGDFTAFERKVHAALPATQIIFISIKPSIRRWPWIEQIKGANALVRQYCATHPNLTFVDIVPQMIGADGKPMKELLVEDGLHNFTPSFSPDGRYKIWNDALRPHLRLSQSSQ